MDDVTAVQLGLVALTAVVAATIAAITGTGGGVILLPVLVATIGVRDAVPAYALAQFVGNLARIGLNRGEIRPRVVLWFTVGAVPMAVLGAVLFARTGDTVIMRLLGLFLLVTVVWRRLRIRRSRGFPVSRFAPIGGMFAFISGLVGSAGPFLAPFFLAFGLVRGAYIGTEALSTAIMHISKMVTYGIDGVFSTRAIIAGGMLWPLMIAGALLGKRIVDRISERVFITIIELALVGFGLWFLLRP